MNILVPQDALRKEYLRLYVPKNEKDKIDSYKIIIDTAFKLLDSQEYKKFKSQMDQEANLLYQMSCLKSLSILKLFGGLSYKNPYTKDFRFNGLIDTFSLISIIRTQFEAYCNFNNIYIYPESQEKKEIIYYLWVISGLKYRQGFASSIRSKNSIIKYYDERRLIQKYKDKIHKNEQYKTLPFKEQSKIDKAIDKKDFQFCIRDTNVTKIGWQRMLKNAEISNLFDNQYAYLSLYTHPSNVSVFQFREMYKGKSYRTLALHSMDISKIIIAFLIKDYCSYFPELKLIFEGMNIYCQLLTNAINRMFRGDKNVLNDTLNLLDK